MREIKKHNGGLFNYSAGAYCGVLVEEHVMKKLAKLQAKQLDEVKQLLHANRDSIYPSGWTLHYPNGNQTTVRFIDEREDVDRRISHATTSNPPRFISKVFIASSMNEAKDMADADFERTGGDDE